MKREHVSRAALFVSLAMHRALAAAMGSALIIAPAGVSRAQQETDSAKAVRHAAAAANLAKAAQNPVANMVSLPLQWNYTTAGGLDSNTAMILNVQPVLPLPIGERWLIVSRTVVPFVSIPLLNGGQVHGIADIQEQAYFTKSKPGKITWAIGPIFSFPTATNFVVRTGQWGLGPTAVVLGMPGPWVIGTLVNNIWRIGGDGARRRAQHLHRAAVHQFQSASCLGHLDGAADHVELECPRVASGGRFRSAWGSRR